LNELEKDRKTTKVLVEIFFILKKNISSHGFSQAALLVKSFCKRLGIWRCGKKDQRKRDQLLPIDVRPYARIYVR